MLQYGGITMAVVMDGSMKLTTLIQKEIPTAAESR